MVGHAHVRLAAVVPAPPWWIAAEHCGSSQSCGTCDHLALPIQSRQRDCSRVYVQAHQVTRE